MLSPFFVLKNNKLKLIPDKLIGGRWLKTPLVKPVHGLLGADIVNDVVVDEKRKSMNDVYASFYELTQHVEGNVDKIHALMGIIGEAKKQLMGDAVVLSALQKKKLIEDFYGTEVPNDIEIHPPEIVKTKGLGSRLKSRKEAHIMQKNKPPRKCGNCNEFGHHDSRNCDKVKGKTREPSQRRSQS